MGLVCERCGRDSSVAMLERVFSRSPDHGQRARPFRHVWASRKASDDDAPWLPEAAPGTDCYVGTETGSSSSSSSGSPFGARASRKTCRFANDSPSFSSSGTPFGTRASSNTARSTQYLPSYSIAPPSPSLLFQLAQATIQQEKERVSEQLKKATASVSANGSSHGGAFRSKANYGFRELEEKTLVSRYGYEKEEEEGGGNGRCGCCASAECGRGSRCLCCCAMPRRGASACETRRLTWRTWVPLTCVLLLLLLVPLWLLLPPSARVMFTRGTPSGHATRAEEAPTHAAMRRMAAAVTAPPPPRVFALPLDAAGAAADHPRRRILATMEEVEATSAAQEPAAPPTMDAASVQH